MYVMALRVEAVLTNPWSSVVRPVDAVSFEMSMASLPSTARRIGKSAVPPGWWRVAVSRGAAASAAVVGALVASVTLPAYGNGNVGRSASGKWGDAQEIPDP